MCCGVYYRLDLYDVRGRPLSPQSVEKQLELIMEDADKHVGKFSITLYVVFTFWLTPGA